MQRNKWEIVENGVLNLLAIITGQHIRFLNWLCFSLSAIFVPSFLTETLKNISLLKRLFCELVCEV